MGYMCEGGGSESGVLVGGTHAVLEGGVWVRVRDAEHSERAIDGDAVFVYELDTSEHRVVAGRRVEPSSAENGIVFADFSEVSHEDVLVARFQEQLLFALESARDAKV